jgi:hypothetical protein
MACCYKVSIRIVQKSAHTAGGTTNYDPFCAGVSQQTKLQRALQ